MKNKIIIFVAIILTVLWWLTFSNPQLMISPGEPIAAHKEFATDCFACHTPFFGSQAEKCIECHKVAEIGITTTKGLPIGKEKKNVAFHQKLIEENCVACHSDHRGVMPFRPISQFSHQLLVPNLQKQCGGCHQVPGDALHRKIKGNCGQCHSQKSWLPATFDHTKYFRFDRDHDAECITCHVNNNYGSYTCYGCHEHSRSNIREEHVEEGIYDYENCTDCHRSADEHEAERLWRSRRSKQNNGSPRVRRHEKDHDDHDEHGEHREHGRYEEHRERDDD